MRFHFLFFILIIADFASHAQIKTDSLLNYSLKVIGTDKNRRGIGNGSGFIIKYDNRFFFVSNYHVITGKDPVTGLKLDGIRDTCSYIAIQFRYMHTEKKLNNLVLPLFDSAGRKMYSTYKYGQREVLDIAIIPIELSSFLDIRDTSYAMSFFDSTFENKGNKPAIVVGFPDGEEIDGWAPNVKVVMLAQFNIPNRVRNPFLFFKQNTRHGMSGSPVFFHDQKADLNTLIGINFGGSGGEDVVKGMAVNIREVIRLISAMTRSGRNDIDLIQ